MDFLGIPRRVWAPALAGVVLLAVAVLVAWKVFGFGLEFQLAPLPGTPR